jgi:cytochrome c biogenesis protein CcmG, thiol:disulfide interchange protein DsbE
MNEGQAYKLAKRMIGLGVVLLLVVFAVSEYRARGARGITGSSVANYAAQAEIQASPAPSFSLPSIDGTEDVGLRALAGKTVVLNFWATWCLPCRREASGLERMSVAYRSEGVRFLGVNERDDNAAARAFVREFQISFPSVSDPSGSLADDYNLFGMPTTFVIDPTGTIRYRFVGYVTEASLRGALDRVLERVTA